MPKLSKPFFAGVFLLSIGMLAAQFLLTRILSIVFWYHFVFMIISIVMFGLTVGTIIIYSFPKIFKPSRTVTHIARYSALSGVAIALAFLSLFYLPGFLVSLFSIKMETIILFYFPVLAVPFILMGIAFSLILTRFPQEIGKIYGVNLIGSAGGCLAAFLILNTFNGASASLFLSALFLLAAVLFSVSSSGHKKLIRGLALLMVVFLAGSGWNQKTDAIQMTWMKDAFDDPPMYAKWNFFSHVGQREPAFVPFGWGFSSKLDRNLIKTKEHILVIDEGAGTVLTFFNRLDDLFYLNYDISALAHHIRPPKSVLVIGAGGGRDLMTAVINGAEKVVGVEINNAVIDIAYTKNDNPVLRYPQIQIHNDDGRSFVARSKEKYDVIQASLVDTLAAASSGTFALSENSLYTKEAWVAYLEHLTPRGILTFSRWYHKEGPLEMYRLVTLAKSALHEIGIRDYRSHLLIARIDNPENWFDVGTLLVSRTPFNDEDIQSFRKTAAQMDFQVALTKDYSIDPVFDGILSQPGDVYGFPWVPGNIDPPTDNKPFYFYFSDFQHFFKNIAKYEQDGPIILRNVTILMVAMGIVFLLFPFFITPQSKGFDKIRLIPTLYFFSIGLAFMFVEIPLIQRLGLFLGHPVYGLTVVLFGLLLFCGLGSMYSSRIRSVRDFKVFSCILLAAIVICACVVPSVLQATMPAPVVVKVLLSLMIVAGLGFLMGIPFPFGVSQVSANSRAPLIFYWAVNGFTSMCATAFATVILINLGFVWAVFIGCLFYCLAFIAIDKN